MNEQWQTKASKEILAELMSKEGVYFDMNFDKYDDLIYDLVMIIDKHFGIEMDNELEQLRADIVEFELRPTEEIV